MNETTSNQVKIPLWLDCDTGHDDAFAILLAARAPNCKLLGISTVYGNATLQHTTYNTRAILKAISRDDVPVYPGAHKPLHREAMHAPDIHGESGLDGTTCLPQPTVPAKTDKPATQAIYEALKAQEPGKAWLVAVGALTNVAKLIQTHPDIIDHLGGLSIMGGAIGGKFTDAILGKIEGQGERFGNYTPYAEFNIFIDPEAAHLIFSNEALAAKTTLITLDLTHQFLATQEVQARLQFGTNASPVGKSSFQNISTLRKLFHEILTFFQKTYADIFGITFGPPLHDPLAVAAALLPHLFYCSAGANAKDEQSERFNIHVVTEGAQGSADPAENTLDSSQVGRTVASPVKTGQPGVKVPRGLAKEELWTLLESCLTATEKASKQGASW